MRASTRRRRTPRLSSRERRARLLEAAGRVFLKAGYAQAKVADIVKQAGVARGTFYAHYESKRNAFLLLAREWLARLLPPAGPAAQPIESREDFETVMRLLHRGVLSALEAERGPARLLFGGGASPNPALARALASHDREWKRRIAQPIAAGKSAGLLRRDLDVDLAAECVLGMVQRAARRMVVDDERLDVDRMAESLARFSAPRLRSAIAVAALSLAASSGCGGDGGPAPSADAWHEARIEGLDRASGVAAWNGWLLFSSATTKDLGAVRVVDVKDGATVRARSVPLDVDGDRVVTFTSAGGPRSFRMKDVWQGEQRMSGLCVVAPEVLYVVSESYRLAWFGPLEIGQDGAPVRCRFERAFDVLGARRTKANASDWHDYAEDGTTDGVVGITSSGEDVSLVERGKGASEAFAYRLDRVSGTLAGESRLAFESADALGTRWWTDVAADARGFLLSMARRPSGGAPATRIVRLARIDLTDLVLGAKPGEKVVEVPDPGPDASAEGMTVASDRLYLVYGDGTPTKPTLLRWRAAP